MDKQAILNRVDHTLLTTTATWDQVKALCDQGLKYHTDKVRPGQGDDLADLHLLLLGQLTGLHDDL